MSYHMIEIESTEKCPLKVGSGEATVCSLKDGSHWLLRLCSGIDSPDCPLNACRCETCDVIGCQIIDYVTVCSMYKPKSKEPAK